MATDDISRGVGMGRLEIEPCKALNNIKEENPFLNPSQRKVVSKTLTQTTKCTCLSQRKRKVSKCKRKHKLLKDPVLKHRIHISLHHSYNIQNRIKNECPYLFHKDVMNVKFTKKCNADDVNLHTLVDNCNQLSISSDKSQTVLKVNNVNDSVQWWNCEANSERQLRDSNTVRSSHGSC